MSMPFTCPVNSPVSASCVSSDTAADNFPDEIIVYVSVEAPLFHHTITTSNPSERNNTTRQTQKNN